MRKLSVYEMSTIGLMAAVCAVCAQISLALPSGVPMTLQTFAIAFAACLLGPVKGTLSVFVYVLLGAFGVPVFAGYKGGFAALTGVTGGFIYGFILMALCCGLGEFFSELMKGKKPLKMGILVACSFFGLMICHALGVMQFAFLTGRNMKQAFLLVSLPYLVKDLVTVVIACVLAMSLRITLKRADLAV